MKGERPELVEVIGERGMKVKVNRLGEKVILTNSNDELGLPAKLSAEDGRIIAKALVARAAEIDGQDEPLLDEPEVDLELDDEVES